MRRLLGGAFVLAATAAGATILDSPGPIAAADPSTTLPATTLPATTLPATTMPDTTMPPTTTPPSTTPPTTKPPVTGPPPSAPQPTAPPTGRSRRTTTTDAPTRRVATTSPAPPGTVDPGAALAPIDPIPTPPSTIVNPSSSSSPPRPSQARRHGAAVAQTRRTSLRSLWWPGA